MLAELADERSTSESASQLLENETAERLRLEKDMKDLQATTHNDIKNIVVLKTVKSREKKMCDSGKV